MELNQAHHVNKQHIRRFFTLVVICSLIFTAVTPVRATSGRSDRSASVRKGPSTVPDSQSSVPDYSDDWVFTDVTGATGTHNGGQFTIFSAWSGWKKGYWQLNLPAADVENNATFCSYVTQPGNTFTGVIIIARSRTNLIDVRYIKGGSYSSGSREICSNFGTNQNLQVIGLRLEAESYGGTTYFENLTLTGFPNMYIVPPVLNDLSTLSNNQPKNGSGDPRECAVSACDASASAGDPIDTRTGNFDYSLVDLSLQTLAGPLTFQRSYASLATDTGLYLTDLGPGWNHNQDTRLVFETGKVWLKAHTLNQYQFTDNGDQTYTPYAGVLASLDYDAGTSSYTLTAADQSAYTFDATGQLQSWRNELGYGFDYSYAGGKLYRVSEPLCGRYLQFNYLGGRLSSVNNSTSRQVSFGYDGSGDLTSFTDARGYTWTYTYDAHRLTILKDPNNQVILTNAYDAQGRAYEQFNGLGERIVKITYNSDGTRTLTDALDRQSLDGYNARGANISHTNSAGYTVFKEYDTNFRLSRILDPEGNAMHSTWSADGANLTAIQDVEGYASDMVYDAENHLIQVTDPRGQVIDYTYVDGLLTQQTRHTLEWGDITTTYTYTTPADSPQPVGLVKTVTDAISHTTTFAYDASGQLVITRDANNQETHFAYDAYGRVTDVTDPLGRVTHTEYDPAGNPRFVTLNYAPGQPQDEQNQYNLLSEFVYDELGRLTQTRRVLDETTTLTESVVYDDAGRIYQRLDALNQATTYGYLPTGQIETITDPLGHTTTYVYDEAQLTGRLTQVQDATGRVTQSYTYYPDGTLETVTTPTVHTATDTTDYVLTYHNDPLKRVVGMTDNVGHSSGVSYDAYGNPLERTDGLGRVTRYSYNELGLLGSVTQNYLENIEPDEETNVPTGYTYNALGQLTALTDANGHTTHYDYDPPGRLHTVTDARQHFTEYGYDANGNRTSMLDANGNTTTFHYDRVNRLHSIDYPGGVSEDVQLWYDALSRLTGMDDDLGRTAWGYDDAGRITSLSDPFGQAVGYGYDDAGRRTSLTYPGGRNITYQYTPDDQLEHVLEGAQPWVDYVYDPYSGRITGAQLANGITTEYAFDYSGQLTGLAHKNAAFNLASYSYHYNAVGSRDHVEETLLYPQFAYLPLIANGGEGTEGLGLEEGFTFEVVPEQAYPAPEGDGLLAPNGLETPYPAPEGSDTSLLQGIWDFLVALFGGQTTPVSAKSDYQEAYPPPSGGGGLNEEPPATQIIDYGYDALNRLTSATTSQGGDYAYSYDPVGNRLTQTVGGVTTTYQYDAADRLFCINGNLITCENGVPVTWDGNGNLLADGVNTYIYDTANRLTAVNGTGSSFTFAYDGLGNRYQSTVNGQTTTYALDLAGGLSQVLSDSANTYLYGLDRLAQQSASGTGYFLPDGLGSVRQVANASGVVGDPWAFDPFGNPVGSSGSSPYGFAGEWTDGTGLQYLRARYYSPEQGRFITRDPFPGYLNQPSTLNPYIYGLNDPATLTDPSGENPFLIVGGLGGLLGGAIYGYGSQVVRNLGQGLCFWDALSYNISAGEVALYTGVGGILGTGMGSAIMGVQALVAYFGAGTTVGTALSADGDPTNEIRTGVNTVYQVVQNGVTKYVGITNDFVRRAGEHLRTRNWVIEPIQGLENLSRADARAVEQVLIERYGLLNLSNQINSISPNNPLYNDSILRGLDILKTLGQ